MDFWKREKFLREDLSGHLRRWIAWTKQGELRWCRMQEGLGYVLFMKVREEGSFGALLDYPTVLVQKSELWIQCGMDWEDIYTVRLPITSRAIKPKRKLLLQELCKTILTSCGLKIEDYMAEAI